jgi:hypothetical protein
LLQDVLVEIRKWLIEVSSHLDLTTRTSKLRAAIRVWHGNQLNVLPVFDNHDRFAASTGSTSCVFASSTVTACGLIYLSNDMC